MISTPSLRKTVSKSGDELGIAITDEKTHWEVTVLDRPTHLAGLLDHPGGGRMGGTAGQMDASCAQFDEEEHVERLEEGCLHREEVTGQDLLAVMGEKAAPRASFLPALRCRRHLLALEHIPHGGPADALAQLDEFAMNAAVAPGRVLPRQTQDQLLTRSVDARPTTWALVRERPLPADQVPMPPQDRLRCEEKHTLHATGDVLSWRYP